MVVAQRIYFDNNATAPMRPEVKQAMTDVFSMTGNASSIHNEGREARKIIEKARDKVAEITGAFAKDIVFTSGGTEANNYVLTPRLAMGRGIYPTRLLLGSTEHLSVLQGNRFPLVSVGLIPVDYYGVVDIGWLEEHLRQNEPGVLVSLQLANNETGVIQPIAQVARLVHDYGSVLHCDVVQALGRIPVDIHQLGADILTLSVHKIGGPQGVGAAVFASPLLTIEDKLVRGGGQERGNRAGTENVAAIAGLGAVLDCVKENFAKEAHISQKLRDLCELAIKNVVPEALILGDSVNRIPNTFSFMVPDRPLETLLIAFDLAGIALSAGAACSSGKVGRSHVLQAMGISKDFGDIALRVSLGWQNTEKDVAHFASVCDRVLSSSVR